MSGLYSETCNVLYRCFDRTSVFVENPILNQHIMEFSTLQLAAVLKIVRDIADLDDDSSDVEFGVIIEGFKHFGITDDAQILDLLKLSEQFSADDALSIASNMSDEQTRQLCAFAGAVICSDGQITEVEEEFWNRFHSWLGYDMTLEQAVRLFNAADNGSSLKRINFNGGYYEGEVRQGLYNGKGRLVFSNGDVKEGNFVDGKLHGQGCYTWASGDKYVGNFVNGQLHGFGEYFYKNGDRYKGCWSEGQRDGFGIYTYANGVIELGEYRQNMRHGAAIQLSKSEAYVDQYSNGTRVKSVKYSGLDLDV